MLGIFSTGLAFTLQATAQRATSATDAALVMSLESVFGAVAASALLGETMTATRWLGAGLIVTSILIAEIGGVTSMALREAWCRSARSLTPRWRSAGAC